MSVAEEQHSITAQLRLGLRRCEPCGRQAAVRCFSQFAGVDSIVANERAAAAAQQRQVCISCADPSTATAKNDLVKKSTRHTS